MTGFGRLDAAVAVCNAASGTKIPSVLCGGACLNSCDCGVTAASLCYETVDLVGNVNGRRRWEVGVRVGQ